MKYLGKLKINSAKMLNYEELINLRGGYGNGCNDKCDGTCAGGTGSCTWHTEPEGHKTCLCNYNK